MGEEKDKAVEFNKIKLTKTYLQIADQIMERIKDGRLPPGSKLPSERHLAVQMGVSRPSVREALIALELMHMVEIRIGQGTYVVGKSGSLDSLKSYELVSPFDLLEARVVIEGNVISLLAEKRKQGTIDKTAFKQAYKNIEEMKRLVAADDQVEQFYLVALEFHRALAESSGNEVLSEMVGSLVKATGNPLWDLINKKILEDREAREDQIKEHEAVLSAIEAGDSQAATLAMRHHLEELNELVLERDTSE